MNYIKLIKNLNINDKAKTKEQYEIIINVSMQEIKRLELCIILQEETMNKYSDVELDIKKFIEYLKGIKNKRFYSFDEYKRFQKFEEELEDIYYVDDSESVESEGYKYCRDTELIKQEIKNTRRKIHKEKFKMCIHKLKLSLPDHLIYKIGTFI